MKKIINAIISWVKDLLGIKPVINTNELIMDSMEHNIVENFSNKRIKNLLEGYEFFMYNNSSNTKICFYLMLLQEADKRGIKYD